MRLPLRLGRHRGPVLLRAVRGEGVSRGQSRNQAQSSRSSEAKAPRRKKFARPGQPKAPEAPGPNRLSKVLILLLRSPTWGLSQ